jgi:flagellar hook-length control protein FliK
MQIAFRTEVFGSVQLRTMIRNGQIGATIGVEKGEAQALLTSELPALERALAQRDLRVDNISIFQQSTAGDTEFSHGSEARSDTHPHRRQQAAAWSLEAEFEDSTELLVELHGATGSPTRLSVRA